MSKNGNAKCEYCFSPVCLLVQQVGGSRHQQRTDHCNRPIVAVVILSIPIPFPGQPVLFRLRGMAVIGMPYNSQDSRRPEDHGGTAAFNNFSLILQSCSLFPWPPPKTGSAGPRRVAVTVAAPLQRDGSDALIDGRGKPKQNIRSFRKIL